MSRKCNFSNPCERLSRTAGASTTLARQRHTNVAIDTWRYVMLWGNGEVWCSPSADTQILTINPYQEHQEFWCIIHTTWIYLSNSLWSGLLAAKVCLNILNTFLIQDKPFMFCGFFATRRELPNDAVAKVGFVQGERYLETKTCSPTAACIRDF